MTKKKIINQTKNDFQLGFAKLMNNPNLSPIGNPDAFNQMRHASGLSIHELISYASGKKKNTKADDEKRAERRINALDK
jgi:hypothetical protein